jgi:hypothetical protein
MYFGDLWISSAIKCEFGFELHKSGAFRSEIEMATPMPSMPVDGKTNVAPGGKPKE